MFGFFGEITLVSCNCVEKNWQAPLSQRHQVNQHVWTLWLPQPFRFEKHVMYSLFFSFFVYIFFASCVCVFLHNKLYSAYLNSAATSLSDVKLSGTWYICSYRSKCSLALLIKTGKKQKEGHANAGGLVSNLQKLLQRSTTADETNIFRTARGIIKDNKSLTINIYSYLKKCCDRNCIIPPGISRK